MRDKSCLIVLIGEKTSERKWVNYEINRAWELGKAVCGVYIHKLENALGEQSSKGKNPLASYIPTFDSSYASSKYVYDDIKNKVTTYHFTVIKRL